ncbi:MAG: hypothetical protein IRZ07_19490 [Microbispora sp.]|nr:hypothetical protein [Microbispora sp.]
MTVAKSIVPAFAAYAATGWFVAGHPAPAAASQTAPHVTVRAAAASHPAPALSNHVTPAVAPRVPDAVGHLTTPVSAAGIGAAVRPPGPGDLAGAGPYGQVLQEVRQGPGLGCAYRLKGVHRGGFLNVRKGAGIRHAPVAKLRPADGGVSGACTAVHGWIEVKTPEGTPGFASARYLHRLDLSGRPSLSCVYRLRHVRKGSFLNVREGAGIHHAPVGRLRPADGNIAGGCDAVHGWVAVETAKGIPGWASAHYLRRL